MKSRISDFLENLIRPANTGPIFAWQHWPNLGGSVAAAPSREGITSFPGDFVFSQFILLPLA